MSTERSPSAGRLFGVLRTYKLLERSRSNLYARRKRLQRLTLSLVRREKGKRGEADQNCHGDSCPIAVLQRTRNSGIIVAPDPIERQGRATKAYTVK